MTKKFFKTTYTVVVLSEDTPATGLELENIAYAIGPGDCVGDVSDDGGVELSAKEAADALIELRSDPGFFQLDAEGNIDGN